MNGSSRSRSGKIKNPLAGFGIWFIIAAVAFIGIAFFAEQAWLLSLILFTCGLFLTVWTLFEFRKGSISLTSTSTGSVYTYTRTKEPVMFFIVVALYLVFGIGLLFSGGYSLLFGWSG